MTTQWSIYKSSERDVQRVFVWPQNIVAVKETNDGHSVLVLESNIELPISANAISVMATLSDPPDPPTIIVQNATGRAPMFRGGAEAFATVNVRDGATIIATAHADATKEWEVGTPAFSVGDHLVSATQTSLFGLVSVPSEPVKLVIAEPLPPPSPTVTAQLTEPTSVTASVAGLAQADAVVILYDGTTVLSTTRADVNGNWTLVTDRLMPGSHSLTATQTSSNGLVSPPSTPVDVVIGEPGPLPVPTLTADLPEPNSTTPTVSGTAEPEAHVIVYDGTTSVASAQADPAGAWTQTTSPFAPGPHTLTATQTNAAGVVSPASVAVEIVIAGQAPPVVIAGAASLTAAEEDRRVFLVAMQNRSAAENAELAALQARYGNVMPLSSPLSGPDEVATS